VPAGIEFEQRATDHEMSNQHSKKQSFPNTTQNWMAFGTTGCYVQLRSFTVFVGLFETLLACSSPKVVIFVELPFLWRSGLTWAKLQALLGRTIVAQWHPYQWQD